MSDTKDSKETREMKEAMMLTAAILVVGSGIVAVLPEDVPVEKKVDVQKSPEEKLMEAAKQGDVQAFEKILGEGADINYQDPNTGKTVVMTAI